MIVIPAIDLRGGRAVRLVRGNPAEETEYSADPVEVAERFQEEGARRLHVVDLDAALEQGSNTDVVKAICHAVAIPVQVGGGIRSLESIGAMLEQGASRAILGTAAAADRRGVRRPRRRGVRGARGGSLDVRGGHLMTRGWTEEGPVLEDVLPALNETGAARYLVTAIARDGTLEGPDLALYGRVLKLTDQPVIARAASATPTTSGRCATWDARRS